MADHEKDLKVVMEFLNRLNRDLSGFIRATVERPEAKKLHWSNLSDLFNPQRCWQIKDCQKPACPAYQSDDYRCWVQAGTMCGGAVQGAFASKYGTCFECEVFQIISRDVLRSLYENIDVLIFHLQDKAAKFHSLAIRDHLTGLYNRRYFNEIIEREAAMSARRSEPLSVVMLDMDGFKAVNDTLGHLTGDRLLQEAAQIIKGTIRRADLAFRFGGDEFLILSIDADCVKNDHLLKRLDGSVEAWNMKSGAAWNCRLSFSHGCSTCHDPGDIDRALAEADRLMYAEKRRKAAENGLPAGEKA